MHWHRTETTRSGELVDMVRIRILSLKTRFNNPYDHKMNRISRKRFDKRVSLKELIEEGDWLLIEWAHEW
jgi:hypothetical protein